MLKEEYKNIPDTEFVPLKEGIDPVFWGKYEINKKGEIKTLKTGKITTDYYNRHSKIPVKSFRVGNKKETYPIHILVAKTFLIKDDDRNEVDHIDRDTLNFKLDNLRWATRRENLENRVFSDDSSLFLVKIDDTGKELQRFSYKDFSKKRRDKILAAIQRGGKSEGVFWKRIDTDFEYYLNKFNIDLLKLEFIDCYENPNLKICKEGIIKRGTIYTAGWKDIGGYRKVSINSKPYYVHRLVYELFNNIKLSPDQLIDHIDTDPENNNLENLRIVTYKENMNNPMTISKLSKSVIKYSLDGKFLEEFSSLTKACASIGINRENNCIQLCCEGKLKTSHGYIWKYKKKDK